MKKPTPKRKRHNAVVREKRDKRHWRHDHPRNAPAGTGIREDRQRALTRRKWVAVRGRVSAARINIPEVFSFIEDPEATLDTISRLTEATQMSFVRGIQLDHSRCKRLDLCASVVMDVTLLQAQVRRTGNQLAFAGKYSENVEVNTMLRASGILKQIAHPDSILPPEVEKTIRTCPLFSGKSSRIERSRECDDAATKLTDYFNSCLKMEKFALSSQGKYLLSSLITEVIGNAEEHGGRWYTIGYFRQSEGDQLGHCHIVIFNFGTTIYESLMQESESDELKSRIGDLIERHNQRGFIRSFLYPKWDEEALVTLYALQEGVSRLSFTPRGRDRGNGTVNMIDFFTKLAGGSEKMCVLSGKAFILFDGKYALESKLVGGGEGRQEERRVVAFNRGNNLELPPDRDYVRSLSSKFPGTLLSIRFDLDRSNLDKLAKRSSTA